MFSEVAEQCCTHRLRPMLGLMCVVLAHKGNSLGLAIVKAICHYHHW